MRKNKSIEIVDMSKLSTHKCVNFAADESVKMKRLRDLAEKTHEEIAEMSADEIKSIIGIRPAFGKTPRDFARGN